MTRHQQLLLTTTPQIVDPFKSGLLKWIGNKQRFAHHIASFFPSQMTTSREPFVGSAAVLATLAPNCGIASDAFLPLIEIWQTLSTDPELLKLWYAERWLFSKEGDKVEQYEKIKSAYNARPNGADLLFVTQPQSVILPTSPQWFGVGWRRPETGAGCQIGHEETVPQLSRHRTRPRALRPRCLSHGIPRRTHALPRTAD